VLSRNPENAVVCSYLSVVLTYQARHEEALAMAKKAVSLGKMSPGSTPDAILYGMLGFSHLMMGQYEESIGAYKKAISLWPEYMRAHISLTAAYSMQAV